MDTGIACHLLGVQDEKVFAAPPFRRGIMENFIVLEILKQLSWSNQRARPYDFRSHTGQEVDLVLEDPAGNVIGMEIKFANTVSSKQFKGLRKLRDNLKERFLRGFVIYTGVDAAPFEDNLFVLPVSALWSP